MSEKLAVKRLTASDLTFFEWQYKKNPSSKQKAINLNADVLVEKLYPDLKNPPSQYRSDKGITIGMSISIYGPGLAGEYTLQRKIVKTLGAKNWRLNGEIVSNPENDPLRFNTLTVNDLAIFDFGQNDIPTSSKVVFIAATVLEDKDIYQSLNTFLGTGRSMATLTPTELEKLAVAADVVADHPIYELTLDTDELSSDVEDIVLGGSGRRARTVSWSSTRKISRADLQKAKENADMIGVRGEQYVYQYLQKLKAKGIIREFAWTASENAISPYDFWISYDGTTKTLIDVKSTQGEFERTLHISLNELLRMREGPEKYAIYRVFDIKEATAQLRIADDLGSWANQILQVFDGLPQGISSDSISLSPDVLRFGPTIGLEIEE